jgi:hypothetical protein
MQSRTAMRRVERSAQDFAINGDDPGRGFAETRGESLKTRAELVGIELAEHVVARDPVLQLQKMAEEFLLGLGKIRPCRPRSGRQIEPRTARSSESPKDRVDSARVLQRGKAVVGPLYRSLRGTATRRHGASRERP